MLGLFETFNLLLYRSSGNTNKQGGSELTQKEKMFCSFVAEGNSIQLACQLAGYKNNVGNNLMKKAEVQEEIQNCISSNNDSNVCLDQEILAFLTEAMRGNGDNEIDIRTRMRAAELLTKRGKLFEKDGEKDTSPKVLIVDDIQ